MEKTKAFEGQLKKHWEKVELIGATNKNLADRITVFTNQLIEANFKGVFTVDDDVYHAGIGISQSRFQYLKKSPNFYNGKTYLKPDDGTSRPIHFKEGDFMHTVILEPERIKEKFISEISILEYAYLAKPEAKSIRATKEYKEKVDMYKALGLTVIKAKLFEEIKELAEYISQEESLSKILKNGIKEKALYAICPDTGLIRKGKTDLISPAGENEVFILDFKSTKNIEPDKFEWSVYNYNYHTQAAYYCDLVKLATGNDVKDYLIMLAEKEAPFELDLRVMDLPAIEIGERNYKKYMAILAACYASGIFPRNELKIRACGIPMSRMNDELLQLGE